MTKSSVTTVDVKGLLPKIPDEIIDRVRTLVAERKAEFKGLSIESGKIVRVELLIKLEDIATEIADALEKYSRSK